MVGTCFIVPQSSQPYQQPAIPSTVKLHILSLFRYPYLWEVRHNCGQGQCEVQKDSSPNQQLVPASPTQMTSVTSDYSMGPKTLSDELQDYVRQPIEKVKDPLKWWVNNCDK